MPKEHWTERLRLRSRRASVTVLGVIGAVFGVVALVRGEVWPAVALLGVGFIGLWWRGT